MVHRAMKSGAAVLLEGAQGSLLDVDHGTYPFVTSSSTTSGGAATGVGIAPTAIDAVLGVVKAYTTRVGTGPLPTEMDDADGASACATLGNEFGATTGRPRRCGWFDAVVVRYATRINGLTDVAVTKLDVLDTLDRIAICTGYEYDGDVHTEFPGDITALDQRRCRGTSGWRDGSSSTGDARRLEDLPAAGARVSRPAAGADRDARSRTSASGRGATRSSDSDGGCRRPRSSSAAGPAGSPRRSRRSARG